MERETESEKREYIKGIGEESFEQPTSGHSPYTKRIKRGAWILFAVFFLSVLVYGLTNGEKSVGKGEEVADAIESHVSTTLPAGMRLLEKDGGYVGGDLTITHQSDASETTLYIWDYAAEDGDYVQVLVDGKPLGNPFMIRNEPATFKVPSVGTVQVVGTRDGGGGITYAVYYALNHTTYFNGMNEGGSNTYTLVRQ